MLKINEKVERWSIFRTNQGTDSHLKMVKAIKQIRPCRPVIIVGIVTEEPRMIPGRHVVFTIGDKTGEADCAAYEPTGKFRNVIKKLTRNDVVKVFGGVRPPSSKHPITINLEKIQLLKLVSKTIMKNPMCKKCGKHMESMGKNKGFRCKKCRNKAYKAKKTIVKINRLLHEELYIPPPRANRHLTKPFSRYGIEKEGFNKFFPSEFWGLKSP
jgi:tRNA(Ile2)-agmatinylcytidine synthase